MGVTIALFHLSFKKLVQIEGEKNLDVQVKLMCMFVMV